MPRLNKYQKQIAIGMLEAGLHHVDVAEHLGVSCGTITRLAARYRVRGIVDDISRSGRPRVTTPVQDRHILTSQLRYRFLPATSTAVVTPGRENDRISAETVRSRLADYGIRARYPYHGLRLTPPRRRYRTHWAHITFVGHRINGHNEILLHSDESQF